MYVATFYSFKGGVGRSMALVNVAVELVARGRRVLMVDFDLEAPGLDTFEIATKKGSAGLIDFVCDYRRSFEVPDVKNYIYKSSASLGKGELWIMPAGRQDGHYDERFRSIDWSKLYEEGDGFLLFEDLKAQWGDMGFHYVLIDSRTGHTDTGGICTRQLPDAVIALFFPNEQNRRGLDSIVSLINDEQTGPRKKSIQVLFVMSNVPDLDDEDLIVASAVDRFRQTLHFETPTAIIHHYDSLALLQQAIFVIERPRSRLAREYKQLTTAIVRRNLEDRDGALAYLEDALRRLRSRDPARSPKFEDQLQEIRLKHRLDPEVLRALAILRRRQRKPEEALAILDEALAARALDPEALLLRAELLISLGDRDRAISDLEQFAIQPSATSFDVTVAIRLMREVCPNLLQILGASSVVEQLEPDFELIHELQRSPNTLSLAERLVRRWIAEPIGSDLLLSLRSELTVTLIGEGRFEDAQRNILESRNLADNLRLDELFNYAMAEWGRTGAVPNDVMKRVVELHGRFDVEGPRISVVPNYHLCIALAFCVSGQMESAREHLNIARECILSRRSLTLSGWSYLIVSPDEFLKDLGELASFLDGDKILPGFIRRTRTVPSV